MTDFERELRQDLLDTIDCICTSLHEEDEEFFDGNEVSDMDLCDCITSETPDDIIERLIEIGEFTGLTKRCGMSACNVIKQEDNFHHKYYDRSRLLYYEADIEMDKDSVYAGYVQIRIKYNTPEDCEDLVQYRFIPKDENEDNIAFKVFHG